MTWQVYRLIFRLETPLHVGQRGWGIIQRTRLYLMGKNLWAATTARLTRFLNSYDYATVGEELKRCAIFSYFYPATGDAAPLWPHYTSDGLRYGSNGMAADEFEYRFIGSYASTAIDPVTQAAEDASLHEVETILPRARDDGAPIYLCGYLLLRKGATVLDHSVTKDELFALLDDVQVGGERGYGYGRLCLKRDEAHSASNYIFGYQVTETAEALPALSVPASKPLPAHALLDGLQARGDIEPLTGREWGSFATREGAGQRMPQGEDVKVCYMPGSTLVADSTFVMLPEQYGILKVS